MPGPVWHCPSTQVPSHSASHEHERRLQLGTEPCPQSKFAGHACEPHGCGTQCLSGVHANPSSQSESTTHPGTHRLSPQQASISQTNGGSPDGQSLSMPHDSRRHPAPPQMETPGGTHDAVLSVQSSLPRHLPAPSSAVLVHPVVVEPDADEVVAPPAPPEPPLPPDPLVSPPHAASAPAVSAAANHPATRPKSSLMRRVYPQTRR